MASFDRARLAERAATEADREFLRHLHHLALRPSVEAMWGWDDQLQDELFDQAFSTTRRRIIEISGVAIGTVRVIPRPGDLYLADIEIAPEHQGRGIGTLLLREVLERAHLKRLPVRLQVIKTNRARRLYERLGFGIEGETPTHYLMATTVPGDVRDG